MRVVLVLFILAQLLLSSGTAGAASALDFALPNGHFFTQANGSGGVGGTGYAIVDANESPASFGVTFVPFASAFRANGGVPILGYPASRLTVFPDFPIQVCQKLVL